MKMQPVSSDLLGKVVQAMSGHALFKSTDARTLSEVANQSLLAHFAADEPILRQGERPETFILLLRGQVVLRIMPPGMGEAIDIERLGPVHVLGELDVLTEQPRRLSVTATEQVLVLQLPAAVLQLLFERAPAFARELTKALAGRLVHEGHQVPLPWYDLERSPPDSETLQLVPPQFVQRQRVVPLRSQGNQVLLGFVDDPTSLALSAARAFLPGSDIVPMRIDPSAFHHLMQSLPAVEDLAPQSQKRSASSSNLAAARVTGSVAMRPIGNQQLSAPKLDPLLKRMIAEGASDLHLSAGHRPRWRIDGEMREIAEAKVLNDTQVYELLEPAMPDRNREQFLADNDTDFAYAVPDLARFRVNMFRDHLGVCTVMRQIPSKILTLEQLGMPATVQKMCDHPKGLVLVTGPTGSGKSTTLAAMIDYINRNRRSHIVTMEDPIEFVHKSQRALINQREIGVHTTSFTRALKAVLREDPDIVLVGELRDHETVAMALETANTGHLVFGTLHTSTAISTVDRIVDLFPPDQQAQIRSTIAEVLRGVVSQTLLKRKGGGRVAALEILVGSHAVANLIREGKTHQIANIMMTSKVQGNTMLNEQLSALVEAGKVDFDEAMMKAIDKADFAKRFGREYFEK